MINQVGCYYSAQKIVFTEYLSKVQFHTGLGDPSLILSLSTPSLLQPLIRSYPNTKLVLLHASYPFTKEAGYLAAMYSNVYLDFGEVFPQVSAGGQRRILGECLELCPSNKLMWSSEPVLCFIYDTPKIDIYLF